MSGSSFTDEFKRDAVAQVEDRGYSVREVAERLGVSTNSICTWQKQFSWPAEVIKEVDAQAGEIPRLKRDLLRVTDLSRTRKQSGRLFSWRMGHPEKPSRAAARLCAVETACAIIAPGWHLPIAYWRVRPR